MLEGGCRRFTAKEHRGAGLGSSRPAPNCASAKEPLIYNQELVGALNGVGRIWLVLCTNKGVKVSPHPQGQQVW